MEGRTRVGQNDALAQRYLVGYCVRGCRITSRRVLATRYLLARCCLAMIVIPLVNTDEEERVSRWSLTTILWPAGNSGLIPRHTRALYRRLPVSHRAVPVENQS